MAAVVAGLVLNARHLPFGFAVADVLAGPWWRKLLGSQVMIDESVAFALRQREQTQRRAAFWVCGVSLFACWNLAVVLGALAGRAVGNTGSLGLDAAFPAVLLALVLPALREERGIVRAAGVGAVIAVVSTRFLPAGLPVLLALAGLVFAGQPAKPLAEVD